MLRFTDRGIYNLSRDVHKTSLVDTGIFRQNIESISQYTVLPKCFLVVFEGDVAKMRTLPYNQQPYVEYAIVIQSQLDRFSSTSETKISQCLKAFGRVARETPSGYCHLTRRNIILEHHGRKSGFGPKYRSTYSSYITKILGLT